MKAFVAIARIGQQGFTLLETMIAVAIMLVAFGAILMVESSSINTTIKAKQMNIVAMLAKGLLIDSEQKFEGKKFEDLNKEETGNFPPPYEDYSWKRAIKELKFPSLSSITPDQTPNQGKDDTDKTSEADTLTKLVTNHLSRAIREVTVTISWKKGKGEQNFSTSIYWVDLNHAFQLTP